MRNIIRSSLCVIAFLFAHSVNGHNIKTGAEQTSLYLPLLKDKKIGLIVNPTSVIGKTHLVDSLKGLGINIRKIFSPEHGFRGDHGAGSHVENTVDPKTGIPIVSLYGKHRKPTKEDLQGIDILIFDIQDVGARFYTYISTMHLAMEACAEYKVKFLILDRPNPNGHYIDGPILEKRFQSFIGMHQVPIVHGMTVGEFAKMINGEYWLKDSLQCELKIIAVKNYNHHLEYKLPVKPSPNLPTMASIYLYPSLCLFEGTPVSIGRGTKKPFECLGTPTMGHGSYMFKPRRIPGVSENPKFKGMDCHGYLLTKFGDSFITSHRRIYLNWIILIYEQDSNKSTFFYKNFDKLAGTDKLRKQIIAGKTQQEIYASWDKGIAKYKKMRRKYLIYPYWENIGLIREDGN
jgi:uncharacterized protein YbbC (DUF1343 family)